MADFSPRVLRNTTRDRELFVDREAELEAVVEVASRGGNVLIAGERRIGKSSLLHRIESELEDRRFRVVWLEGRLAESPHDILAQLLDGFATADQLPGLREPTAAIRRHRSQSGTELLDHLAELRTALAAGDRAIALVDEPASDVGRTLFGRLRDELWELPITWVVTAMDRAGLTDPPADAFWTRVVTLQPLESSSATALLRKRMGSEHADDDLVEKIVKESEGSPGRLVSFAHDVFVAGGDADKTIAERQERDRLAEALGTSAQRLLADLERNGPASASDPNLLRRLQWNRSRAAQVLKRLERAGLVTASDRPGAAGRPQRVYEIVRR